VNQVLTAVEALVAAEGFGSRATVVAGPGFGDTALIVDRSITAGELSAAVADSVLADASALLSRERSLTLSYDEVEVYIESLVPRPILSIFGAVHIGQELAVLGRQLGFSVVVSDARAAFTTPDRFPGVDRLLVGWPDQVDLSFDRRTYVVVLSHDARFEDPLWPIVLASPAPYIGAMGSTGTARRRRERLLAEGYDPSMIARIHGPVGLPIGAEAPAEVAVAIMAEIIKARHQPDQPLELIGKATNL
jgi:xanthine dehydrogenase accessory factor